MLNFVLVHGAFHGGWCWSECAAEITRQGARVFTPSLTGLGDRRHLFSPSISLQTHVDDIVNLIEYERLDGCILVGHSYAGNVISGVGDQLRGRVGHYIFVDATVPPPGAKSWRWPDSNPSQFEVRRKVMREQGQDMMIPPFPAASFGVTDPVQAASVESRLTPMPRDCFLKSIQLYNRATEGLKRSYIAAADPPYDNMRATIARVSTQAGWNFRSIATGHDMMVTEPLQLAAMLLDLAGLPDVPAND